jgi:endoglucanase
VLAAVGLAAASSAGRAETVIRVDQLGYEPGRAAHASLMTGPRDRVDRVDVVAADGTVVARATLAGAPKRWGAWQVRRLDFVVPDAGRYALVARGPHVAARSPAFPVDDGDTLYGEALQHALAFYQVERDGPDFIAGPLRTAPGHLNDAQATAYESPVFNGSDEIVGALVPTGRTLDASGGWWDAGDYLKFVVTHSYVVGALLTGVRDFPRVMDSAQGGAAFDAEARFGLEWLLRMWDDASGTLYYQVGLGTDFVSLPYVSDHDLWRLPQVDDTLGGDDVAHRYIRHRPVLQAGPPGAPVSPNLAGRLAASFALGARVFRDRDPTFAATCLKAAAHVYELADRHPTKPLLTSAPFDFYGETSWQDDLEWGATELALAIRAWPGELPPGLPHTSPGYYLRDAAGWARRVLDASPAGSDPLGMYDTSAFAHFDLWRALGRLAPLDAPPDAPAVSRRDLEKALVAPVKRAHEAAAADPFGFGTPWQNWDSTSRGLGISVLAAEVAVVEGDDAWAADSRQWLGNVLGDNAWGLSLLVGDGASFPLCLQHQVANLVGSLDGGADGAPVLDGAAVEGPNATRSVKLGTPGGARRCPANGGDRFARFDGHDAEFSDRVSNYPNTEPAIDLGAAAPLAFAWRIARQPDDGALGF